MFAFGAILLDSGHQLKQAMQWMNLRSEFSSGFILHWTWNSQFRNNPKSSIIYSLFYFCNVTLGSEISPVTSIVDFDGKCGKYSK
ncbi:hypothetical protein RJT34_15713 [Clitoria ternatea]|uniref:Uncharacterized protein n=1 Tax=Clitoria ternatea TaxID=43366 RepID=A0AAN9J6Y7_CLITE